MLGPLKVSMWDIMSWESDDNGMDMVIFVGILLALGTLGTCRERKEWYMLKEGLRFFVGDPKFYKMGKWAYLEGELDLRWKI